MKIKIGIVGLGRIGERHLNAYLNLGDVEIGGICDVDKTLTIPVSKQHGIPRFDNFEQLLESDIDAIDVCVPTVYHHEIILNALERKKNVFAKSR